MKNPPFADVFPIGKGGFPASYVSLPDAIFEGENLSFVWNDSA